METCIMLKNNIFSWQHLCLVVVILSGLCLMGCQSNTSQPRRTNYSLSSQGNLVNRYTMINGANGLQPAANEYVETEGDILKTKMRPRDYSRKQHIHVGQRAPSHVEETVDNNYNLDEHQYRDANNASQHSVSEGASIPSQKNYSRIDEVGGLSTASGTSGYHSPKPGVGHVSTVDIPEKETPSAGVLGVAHVANYGMHNKPPQNRLVTSATPSAKYNLSPEELLLRTPQSPLYNTQEVIPASSQFRGGNVVAQSRQDQMVAITANLQKLIDDPTISSGDVDKMHKTVLSIAEALGRKSGIEISHLEICKPQTVKGFGDYLVMTRRELGSGKPLTFNIYFELVNFETTVKPNGKHLANIAASIKLALLNDDDTVQHVINGVGMTMKKVDDKGSFQKRKDYYINGMFNLPRLTAGKYQLIVSVEDRIAGKTAKPARYAFKVGMDTNINPKYNNF
jgi:hypothetical protein